ncbi:MAG: TetR/AcrR family transcriptional regulator [Pseudonocardia sp.]|nr:TetR/AcrR family transcriptional regulator [Pseudonocardia sp.]
MRGDTTDDARARILAAAEELFGARSYAGTRVSDVAAAAGIATGSFYRHFPDKEQLLVEVLRGLNQQLRDAMAVAIDGAGTQREVERRAFTAFFAFLAAHPHLFRIQRQVEFVAPAAYREYFDELARRYARGAKDAMIRGEIDPGFDPELIGFVYLGVAHFAGMRWIEWTGGAAFPDDVAEQLFRLLGRALAPHSDTS